jgi:HK97 family phage prohead protease
MSQHVEPAVERELRYASVPLVNVNFRDAEATGDGSWLIEGYAAVYDERTTLYDGKFVRVTEDIAPGAFSNVLGRDDTLVHLNYVHDMQSAVASTDAPGPIGKLLLSEDERGLRFEARVDRDDPDVQRMAVKMRRGVAAQASFAFTIAEEDTESRSLDGGKVEDHYRILEVGDLYDVCVCPRGAYQQTVSTLRSYAAAIGRSPEGEGHPRRSVTEGVQDVAQAEGVPESKQPSRVALAKAKARARLQMLEKDQA